MSRLTPVFSEPYLLARKVAATQHRVITRAQAVDCGLGDVEIAYFVRRGIWRRLFAEVYFVDPELEPETPRLAILRAALLRYGDKAVLWGASAAEVHGIAGVIGWPGRPWVMLPVDEPVPQPRDMRLRFREWCPAEICEVDGLRVNVPPRTLADLVALVDRPTGLSLLDSALNREVVPDLTEVIEMSNRRRGALKIRELAKVADRRAASPLESIVRLACIRGEVPPDELQWPVEDRHGNLLGYADMAWLKGRKRPLLGEADGEDPHSKPMPVYRDRHRGNDFTGAAADTVRFTWLDAKRPAYIWSVVRRALAAS